MASIAATCYGQGPAPPYAPTRAASTIFYLPDVIDHMPRHAPDRVAGVPSPSNQGLAGGELAQHGSDLSPHGFERALVVHLKRFVSHPDLARISPFGFDDVTPNLVSVATSATRTFAQFRRRSRDDLIQYVPRCAQERHVAGSLFPQSAPDLSSCSHHWYIGKGQSLLR
jgi:hypothetical protein